MPRESQWLWQTVCKTVPFGGVDRNHRCGTILEGQGCNASDGAIREKI